MWDGHQRTTPLEDTIDETMNELMEVRMRYPMCRIEHYADAFWCIATTWTRVP